jgi:hypothetical protein
MPSAVAAQTRADLKALLGSRVPLIVIETRDEPHALEPRKSVALELHFKTHMPVFRWTVTDGVQRIDIDLEPQRHNSDPTEALSNIWAGEKPEMYVLLDIHAYLQDPKHVRLLKDICLGHVRCPRTIVLIGHEISVPRELEHFAARVDIANPDRVQRERIVDRVAQAWAKTQGARALRSSCRRATRGQPERPPDLRCRTTGSLRHLRRRRADSERP